MKDRAETELVQDAMAGDLASFGELCERYFCSMVAIGYACLRDHHLAEDIAQEAFAKALVKLPHLQQPERFGSWLARICRNSARDVLRKKTEVNNVADFTRFPGRTACENSDHAVEKAIGKLSPAARELIVLRYYHKMSYEQMTEVLGLSKAAINGRLNRAKQKLAKILKRDGFPEYKS